MTTNKFFEQGKEEALSVFDCGTLEEVRAQAIKDSGLTVDSEVEKFEEGFTESWFVLDSTNQYITDHNHMCSDEEDWM